MRIDCYRLKYSIKYIFNAIKKSLSKDRLEINYDNSIIVLLACDYNNMGDALIRFAQEAFIKSNTTQGTVITVGLHDTLRYLKDIAKNATRSTTIVLSGGGNTNDRYTEMERLRNYTIRLLRRNNCRIIGFPQTIDYTETRKGRYYLNKAKKAYSSNHNFVFSVREKKSHIFALKHFNGVKVLLVPDIALSYPTITSYEERSGIGLLMRSDEERYLDDRFSRRILENLQSYEIYKNDMKVKSFSDKNMGDYLQEKMDFVSKREVVLTDRLHGMVICYITNTPCIVFPSLNHKILETYNNWLKGKQNFIMFESNKNVKEVLERIQSLRNIKTIKKDSLDRHYLGLIKTINGQDTK